MKRTRIFVALSLSAAAIGLYGLTATQETVKPMPIVEAAEETPGPVQILETSELMKLLVDPTFEDLKDAISVAPEARKDWRTLYIAAFNLAEINNLFFSRVDEDFMKSEEWTAVLVKTRTEAIDLAEAVRNRAEYDVLKEKFNVVLQSCNDCHTKFSADADIDQIEGPLAWTQ